MTNSSFSYTNAIHALCRDVCRRVREFRNIDADRIGYSFSVARNGGTKEGVWASITPLRFERGSLVTVRERRVGTISPLGKRIVLVQREYFKARSVLNASGVELMYIFNVMAPRFVDLSLIEKIDTVMHELYHIDPTFNGDVRRFPGRNWQHGNKKAYDAKAASLRDEWLASDPDPRLYEFLKYDMASLRAKYSRIVGERFSKIPLTRITEEEASRIDPRIKSRQ